MLTPDRVPTEITRANAVKTHSEAIVRVAMIPSFSGFETRRFHTRRRGRIMTGGCE